MKKIYFALLFALLSGLLSGNKANAECPPGWSEVEIIQPYIGDCRIRINYCYKCGVTGADPSNIKITFYGWENPQDPDCIGEIPFEIVWEAIRQSFYNLCRIPTCFEGKLRVVEEYPICQKIIRVSENLYFTTPCNLDVYCQFIMEVCYNLATKQYGSECIGFEIFGDPNRCLPVQPPLPPPGYESECYIANGCNCPE
ncbi:MAG: hypothetical protein ACP5I9_10100 [Candidatus Kapaibacteriota bacterium]